MTEPKVPKSLIQAFLKLNEQAGGKLKLFIFAFLREDAIGNVRKQEVRAAFAVAESIEGGIASVRALESLFNKYQMVSHIEMDLGDNPEKVKADTLPAVAKPKEKPITVSSKNIINVLKLLKDDFAKSPTEKKSFDNILKRVEEEKNGTR